MADREIVIRIAIPRWSKRQWLGVVVVVTAVAGAVAYAMPLTLTSFTGGKQISSKDVNDNFTAIQAAIQKLQANANGTVCGYTLPTKGDLSGIGGVIGYPGAKQACVKASGCNNSPTAHVCTPTEIVSYLSAGNAIGSPQTPDVWIAGGSSGANAGGSYSTDCLGFTSSGTSQAGSTFLYGLPGRPAVDSCDKPKNLACCDFLP